jgi:hypothetical protein
MRFLAMVFFLFIISFAQVNFWETKNSQIVLVHISDYSWVSVWIMTMTRVWIPLSKIRAYFLVYLAVFFFFTKVRIHIIVTLYAWRCGSGSCMYQTESAELIWFLDPDPGIRNAPKTRKKISSCFGELESSPRALKAFQGGLKGNFGDSLWTFCLFVQL